MTVDILRSLIYNHVVMCEEQLNLVFAALADPPRRCMLAQLAEGESNVSALAEPHDMSQPAISKHLRVLEKAGFIQRTRQGREHRIHVDLQAIEIAGTWIGHYQEFWERQFSAVDAYLKAQKKDKQSDREPEERPKS